MIKMFFDSLRSLKAVYEFRNTKWIKVIIYFLLLILIFTFPVNLANVRNKGLRIDKEKQKITNLITKDYRNDLPNDCDINSVNGLNCHESKNIIIDAGDLTLIFLPDEDVNITDNSLVFYHEKIVFYYDKQIKESYYTNYDEIIVFQKLKTLELDESIKQLISGFQESFSPIDTINAIIFTTGSNILINTIYIIIASLIAMLFKYAHKRFLKYSEILKIYIFSSTWPTIGGLIIGVFKLYPFANIIYQFGTPIMFLLVYYKQIKPNLES